jgi:hypothetical protein
MGLEPTTFCMANARDRSHPFASVRSNHLFAATTVRASEPERTPTAAIAAIAIVATFNLRGPVARPRPSDRRSLPPRSLTSLPSARSSLQIPATEFTNPTGLPARREPDLPAAVPADLPERQPVHAPKLARRHAFVTRTLKGFKALVHAAEYLVAGVRPAEPREGF